MKISEMDQGVPVELGILWPPRVFLVQSEQDPARCLGHLPVLPGFFELVYEQPQPLLDGGYLVFVDPVPLLGQWYRSSVCADLSKYFS